MDNNSLLNCQFNKGMLYSVIILRIIKLVTRPEIKF